MPVKLAGQPRHSIIAMIPDILNDRLHIRRNIRIRLPPRIDHRVKSLGKTLI